VHYSTVLNNQKPYLVYNKNNYKQQLLDNLNKKHPDQKLLFELVDNIKNLNQYEILNLALGIYNNKFDDEDEILEVLANNLISASIVNADTLILINLAIYSGQFSDLDDEVLSDLIDHFSTENNILHVVDALMTDRFDDNAKLSVVLDILSEAKHITTHKYVVNALLNGKFGKDTIILKKIISALTKFKITDASTKNNIVRAILNGRFGCNPDLQQLLSHKLIEMNINDPKLVKYIEQTALNSKVDFEENFTKNPKVDFHKDFVITDKYCSTKTILKTV
jgi:hypothetical protein